MKEKESTYSGNVTLSNWDYFRIFVEPYSVVISKRSATVIKRDTFKMGSKKSDSQKQGT